MKKEWGVIYNSVGNMRLEPRHSAELVTQVLLGETVRIKKEQGDWHKIETNDRYTGWISGALQPIDVSNLDDYLQQPKVVVVVAHSYAFEDTTCSTIVCDLVMGNMLVVQSKNGMFYKVGLPDGRVAYLDESHVVPVDEWLRGIELSGGSIVNSAKMFLGVPYLWGGASSKGLDCSGLTKMVFFMHALVIPRDASQQVKVGKEIDFVGDFDGVLPGDLLFFGLKISDDNPLEKVTHVGIYIGEKRFIHASDYVRIASFDPNDSLYDEFNANRYLRTKRLLDGGMVIDGEGVININNI